MVVRVLSRKPFVLRSEVVAVGFEVRVDSRLQFVDPVIKFGVLRLQSSVLGPEFLEFGLEVRIDSCLQFVDPVVKFGVLRPQPLVFSPESPTSACSSAFAA